MTFLSIGNLSLAYPAPRGFWRKTPPAPALHEVSFDLDAGDRVGLVGVSGSGKSSLLRCLLALEAPQAGQIFCDGRAVLPGSVASLRWYRRMVQYIPQDPAGSLEPRMTVLQLVTEPLLRLHIDRNPEQLAKQALASIGLDHRFLSRRPGELSGGQAQRVAIARAIAMRPVFLLADEPVSGLDMTIRAQVARVLKDLSTDQGTGFLMVSHDISILAELCQRILVMQEGRIVEDRPTRDLLRDPHHPHTQELLNAAPPMIAAA
ncbi:ABC transporter ATP-binding protein [Ruegeria jejuensis]|uniref:ABC transporter ATP-binding protein n=1 Tax=Ruegeria jejuensis TaxID=3233338 RepID=UPI00355BAE34